MNIEPDDNANVNGPERRKALPEGEISPKFYLRRAITLVVVLPIVVLGVLFFLYYMGSRMTERNAPLLHASFEVRFQLSQFHLWLEELLQGDTSLPKEEVWKYFDEAEAFSYAMLEGGVVQEGTILPLENRKLRSSIKHFIILMHDLEEISEARLENRAAGKIGSEIDQRFDAIFFRVLENAKEVERTIKADIDKQSEQYRSLIIVLGGGIIVFAILVGNGFLHFERRRLNAANKLVESENRFKRLFEKAPLGYQSLNVDGEFIEVNQAWLNLFGYSREEVIGRSFEDFFVEKSEFRKTFPRFKKVGEAVIPSGEFICKDGSTRIIHIDGRIGYDEQGNFLQTHCILTDVSERKRWEEEILTRVTQQRTVASLGLLSLSGASLSEFMDIVAERTANTLGVEYCKIMELLPDGSEVLLRAGVGWKPGLVGTTTISTAKDSQAGYTLRSREPVIVDDLRTETRFKGLPLLCDHGVVSGMSVIIGKLDRPYGVLGVHTATHRIFTQDDISFLQAITNLLSLTITRHVNEVSLKKAISSAEYANRSKTEFLANMSHELRTPLNSVIGFAELLLNDTKDRFGEERRLEYLEDILVSGQHLLELINEILDVSKVETGEMKLAEMKVDVGGTVISCVNLVSEQVVKAGITLSTDVADDLPPLFADETKVKQILLNLLSNGIKFTPKGGRVSIGARINDQDELVIDIADTGIGIAAEDIPKALEPFEQVETLYTRTHEGTGLGLSLSKSLTELHGGSLEIDSEVGKGTTVTVKFPPERMVSSS